MSASVVDLFCGVGGLTQGFVKEGFDVVAGIDADPTCKYPFTINNGSKFILRDVDELTAKEVIALFPADKIKVLVGCAPCQPFSKYANRKLIDDKWQLVGKFAALIRDVKPEIISMENVPELRKHGIFDHFISELHKEGYWIWHDVVDCADYGVPQTRKRLVLLASKLSDIEIVPKTHSLSRQRTVKQTIQKLPKILAGETCSKDPLHRSSALSDKNLQRISVTPPGGSWKDWPEALVLDCHKKESGKTYPSVYGRMKWLAPGPTITTQCHGLGNGRFGHPEQDRAISLREAALLQTFPSNYKFVEPGAPVVISHVARHIGNAVPVRLGRIIARSIKKHLEANIG